MSVTLSSNISLSSHSPRREEDLINAYEYEEERITNSLFSKLEQLRREKTQLENTLEAESESQVNRLNRQIAALRQTLQEQTTRGIASSSDAAESRDEQHAESSTSAARRQAMSPVRTSTIRPSEPNTSSIIEALRRENDSLRRRLIHVERDYVRVTRTNDIYREELIQHRTRLGLPVDSLIGLSGPSITNSPAESFSQPTHLRSDTYTDSRSGSPTFHMSSPEPRRTASPPNRATGATPIPIHPTAPLAAITTVTAPVAMGVPIPRSSSGHQLQRHHSMILSSTSSSASTEPSSTTTTSPSSSLPPSPFTFSPPATTTFNTHFQRNGARPRTTSEALYYQEQDQDMAFSSGTQLTTPPSSNPSPFAFHLPVIHQHLPLNIPPGGHGGAWGLGPQLTYPSVPPPSLSSSLGSPIISRRNSVGAQQQQQRTNSPPPTSPIAESVDEYGGGDAQTNAAEANAGELSRRRSVERGARIAETGSLVPRRRGTGNDSRRGATGSSSRSRGAGRPRRAGEGSYS